MYRLIVFAVHLAKFDGREKGPSFSMIKSEII